MVMNLDSIAFVPTSLYVGCDPDIPESQLFVLFSIIGNVSSVQICRDSITRRSLGYGYVNYFSREDATRAIEILNHIPLHGTLTRVKVESEISAEKAIENVNGCTIAGKEIYVGHSVGKNDQFVLNPEVEYTNLNIKKLDLDLDLTVEHLQKKLEFGKFSKLTILKDSNGKSKGVAFVNFETPDNAKRAMEEINGTQVGSKIIYVADLEQILRQQFDERPKEHFQKHKGSNWYVRNINLDVHDDELREVFSQCCTITSVGLMRDDNGKSRGFDFICFSTPKEAGKAVNILHGFMLHEKPLFVVIKDNRQEKLQLPYSNNLLETEKSELLISPDSMIRKVEEEEQMLQLRRGIQHMEKPSSYTIIAAAKYVQDTSHKGPGIVCCVDSKGVQLKTTLSYKEGDVRVVSKCRSIGERFYVLLAGSYKELAQILKNFKSVGVDKSLMEYAVSAHETIQSEFLEEVSIILVGYTKTEGHEIISVSTEDGLRKIESGVMAGCGVSHIHPGEVFFHENMSSDYACTQVIKAVKVAIERNPTRCGNPKVFLRIQGEEVYGPKVIENHLLPDLIIEN